MNQPESLPPLCVDLDGTLVAGDTLVISAWLLARRKPWLLPFLPFWLLRGKAWLKESIARAVVPDCVALPYRVDVVEYLAAERTRRRVILATAANERIARAVAEHLGVFDTVLASDALRNLKGEQKLEAIRGAVEGEFDYLGDSLDDLPVFREARRAVLVYPRRGVRERVCAVCTIHEVIEKAG